MLCDPWSLCRFSILLDNILEVSIIKGEEMRVVCILVTSYPMNLQHIKIEKWNLIEFIFYC